MTRLLILCLAVLTMACASSEPDTEDGGTKDDGTPIDDSRIAQYIRSTQFAKLVVEVDSVPGSEPRVTAETDVVALLNQLLDKPAGIEAVRDGVIASRGVDYAWTDSELFELAEQTFDLSVSIETVKMHTMFVDGHSARDSDDGVILGLAWNNTHLVMFKQTIESICAGPQTPEAIREQLCRNAEFSIWVHETGHLLGLVNAGLPMVEDHHDAEHSAHDINEECVMYWAYEGGALIDSMRQKLMGGDVEPLDFDDKCLADIAAVRDSP